MHELQRVHVARLPVRLQQQVGEQGLVLVLAQGQAQELASRLHRVSTEKHRKLYRMMRGMVTGKIQTTAVMEACLPSAAPSSTHADV